MRWVYVVGGLGGGLTPPIYFYLRLTINPNYAGPFVDPYLFIRGMAISAPTIPLFLALGLLFAAFIQVAIRYFRRGFSSVEGKGKRADTTFSVRSSWVTRRHRR